MIHVSIETDKDQKWVKYLFDIGQPDATINGRACHRFDARVTMPWLVQSLGWLGLELICEIEDPELGTTQYWAEAKHE